LNELSKQQAKQFGKNIWFIADDELPFKLIQANQHRIILRAFFRYNLILIYGNLL